MRDDWDDRGTLQVDNCLKPVPAFKVSRPNTILAVVSVVTLRATVGQVAPSRHGVHLAQVASMCTSTMADTCGCADAYADAYNRRIPPK